MQNLEAIVHTHAPKQLLSRLTLYRLKRAKADYLMAAADLEDRYQEKVRAILGNDRQATEDLRNGVPANYRFIRNRNGFASEAIVNTNDSTLTPCPGAPRPYWMVSIASLLHRHGYKQTVRIR